MTQEINKPLAENVTPDRMKAIEAAVAKFKESKGQTVSGSEAVDGAPSTVQTTMPTGKDVDWDQYDLDFNVAHLYRRAVVREVEGQPKWVVVLTEFMSYEGSAGLQGQRTKEGAPKNLAEFMSEAVNGHEGWKVVTVLPGSVGRLCAVFERQVPYVLPDPRPIMSTEEVEPPQDMELARMDEETREWMAEQGLTPAAPPATVDLSGVAAEDAAEALQGDDFGTESQ